MNENENKSVAAGNLLISEPFLQDENFVRSVVLLCENNENGSFGLVLNKLSILKLKELIDDISSLDCDVYVGGPVEQNTLHFIYRGSRLFEESIQLGEDLWWGGDFDELLERLKLGKIQENSIRFFIGYSGWGAGQLDDELQDKTWIVCEKIDSESIFTASPEELWRIILKNMGGEYQQLANYPIDPRLN
ncbi:MAG: YqgE/AlgH family protein [Cecembia sp.]